MSEEGTKADWDVGWVWKSFTPSLRVLSLFKKFSPSAVKLKKEYKRKHEAVTQ